MCKYTALHVMPFVIFITHFWVQFCQTVSLLVVHFHHIQNTAGKLMEHTVTRKLTRDLEDRKILPVNQGGFRPGKCTWEIAPAFPYVHRGFQRKEQTVAVAIDLKDAYNRVQFKLLLDLLIQYGVSLTLTRWAAGTPRKRTVVMKLGNWSSAPHQFTMGLPQWSPLSPVFFNVYTKGLADLNQNGPSKILTLADDRLIKIYKTSKDFQEVAEAVQQQLDSVSKWCHDTRSLLNPDKAQTVWCTLDNRAAGKLMPAVIFDGAVVEQTSHLRYLGIHFDRILTYRKQQH